MQKYDKVACVGTSIKKFYETAAEENIVLYPETLTFENLNYLLEEENSFLQGLFKLRLCMNGSVVFKRDIVEKFGGWDGRTRIGADTDIFIRILSTYKINNLKEVLYKRKMHNKSLTGSKKYGFNSEIRKQYALGLKEVVEKSVNKEAIIRNFHYPKFEYEII